MFAAPNTVPSVETPVEHAARSLADILAESAALHRHLCPKQVLGARMGLLGARTLGVAWPNADKRLLVLAETDGCSADGLSAATGCTVGHRTLRVIDHGKVAATFVDTRTGQAVRVVPHPDARGAALRYALNAESPWRAQRDAYQIMPDEELLIVRRVELTVSIERLLSKPGLRVACHVCGEDIINEREVVQGDRILCRACAGDSYYQYITKRS
jgi:formylmethanofuran dehydrogenase subunit E